jgi:DNA-binding GntR family transcriptional regulator
MTRTSTTNGSPGGDERPVRAKGTSVNEAYERLRADILDLTLAPGSLLDEREQVDRLGLSRTPIHEAFVRLAAEDLIIMEPNRQAQVAPLDIRDLPLYVEATDLAHRTVVHLASKRRTDADIASMKAAAQAFEAAIARRDPITMTEANRLFHASVAQACHNPYLFGNYDRLLTLGLRMLRSRHLYQSFDSAGLERQSREHYAIIGAIEDGNAALAEELAHNHTKEFVDRYVRSLQENLTGDILIRRG